MNLKRLRIALNEVAKRIALEIVWKNIVNGKIKGSNAGKEWLQIAKDLMMT